MIHPSGAVALDYGPPRVGFRAEDLRDDYLIPGGKRFVESGLAKPVLIVVWPRLLRCWLVDKFFRSPNTKDFFRPFANEVSAGADGCGFVSEGWTREVAPAQAIEVAKRGGRLSEDPQAREALLISVEWRGRKTLSTEIPFERRSSGDVIWGAMAMRETAVSQGRVAPLLGPVDGP